jgi:hypothetical protein
MNMKSKLYILLLPLLLFALQGCVEDEEKVFDKPASERVDAAISDYKATLCGAPNGWVMEYYPEADRSKGGYYLICKFSANGNVDIAGEVQVSTSSTTYTPGTPVTSTYDVIAEESVVLTFDTYNEILHYFVNPSASDIDGFAGDYEFVIREATPQQIVMTGKKYGNRIMMTPYSGTATWGAFLTQFGMRDEEMRAFTYEMRVDGTTPANVKKVTRDYATRTFRFTFEGEEDKRIVPYIPTATGMKLYEPLTIAGKTAQHFIFNPANETLTGVEGNIVLALSAIPPNRLLSEVDDFWSITPDNSSPSMNSLLQGTIDTLSDTYDLKLYYLFMGDSPFTGNVAPGRGIVFIAAYVSLNQYKEWDLQFLCDFTPVDGTTDRINIEYKGIGFNQSVTNFDANFNPDPGVYEPFLKALADKSPYRVTIAGHPKRPTRMTLTSAADASFYLALTY